MADFVRLVFRGMGWRLGAICAVALVGVFKHWLG